MAKIVRWMMCRCQLCGREFKMPIDQNLMSRLPDAYKFCCDECKDSFYTMGSGGITPKQQKYQRLHNNMGNAATKGLGINSEESGVRKLQQKYRIKKFRGLQ